MARGGEDATFGGSRGRWWSDKPRKQQQRWQQQLLDLKQQRPAKQISQFAPLSTAAKLRFLLHLAAPQANSHRPSASWLKRCTHTHRLVGARPAHGQSRIPLLNLDPWAPYDCIAYDLMDVALERLDANRDKTPKLVTASPPG
jgi:hypothetical protein